MVCLRSAAGWCASILLGGCACTICGQAAVATEPASDAASDRAATQSRAKRQAQRLPSILVTADKIEQPLERVPGSLSVLDATDIRDAGIERIGQLEGRIPGLSFQPFGQSGMEAPVMRGLTASVHSYSSSVLMMVDDVPTLMPQGFENDFVDVERVEVLRGPQSTLYGHNAEAGVIAIHSWPLDEQPRAMLSTELGNRARRALRFAFSGPLLRDTLYAGLSGSWLEHDGFIRDLRRGGKADDRRHRDLKAGLRWTPAAGSELVLRYVRQDYHDGATLWGSTRMPRAEVASGTPSWNRSLGQTFSLNAAQTLAPGLRLRSITAYNDYRDSVLQDTDFTPAELLYIGRENHFRTWSEELRMEGRLGESDWLAGFYADQGDQSLRNYMLRSPTFMDFRGRLQTRSMALFTNWNMPLGERWRLGAGARVERLYARIKPRDDTRLQHHWTYVSPKLSLQYQFDPGNQWYASLGRGTRAGGYNVFVSVLDYPAYAPEQSWSAETGFKGWVLDRRLRYSAAGYTTRIDNMQVQMQPAIGVIYIASAAKATSHGVELELDYLLGGGWKFDAGLSWNHTTFDRFRDGAHNYAGHYNSYVPKLNGHAGLRYTAPAAWYAQIDVIASSKLYLDVSNAYARSGFALVNLVAAYPRDHWEIAAYANNVANRRYDAVGYNAGYYTIYSPPREFGMRLSWRL